MLSEPCLAPPPLLPKGSPAATPRPGAVPWGQQQMLPGSEVPWLSYFFSARVMDHTTGLCVTDVAYNALTPG